MGSEACSRSEEVSFPVFLQTWLQLILDRLVDVPREPVHEAEHRAIVAEVIHHLASYFSAKALRCSAISLYPPWASLLARALLWMGGWRPTAALRLVPHAGALSAEQVSAVEAIRAVTIAKVAALEREMRRVQNEGVVGLAMVLGKGAATEAAAIGRAVARQWLVAVAADSLRMEVARRVVGVLTPLQAVDFLAAIVRMELDLNA